MLCLKERLQTNEDETKKNVKMLYDVQLSLDLMKYHDIVNKCHLSCTTYFTIANSIRFSEEKRSDRARSLNRDLLGVLLKKQNILRIPCFL